MKRCQHAVFPDAETQICMKKGMDEMAAAFFSEFLVELIKLVVLGVVAVAAIFCGKKLRDRKDAKISK